MNDVEVYAVGVLDAWKCRRIPGRLRREARYLWERVRVGEWRRVKSAFNGYLAEPRVWPDGLKRCGSGWTRRRALRSLARHVSRIG